MAQQLTRLSPWILTASLLLGVALLLSPGGQAGAATYTDPFWSNTSSEPEVAPSPGTPRPDEWSAEGVNYRTGSLRLFFGLFETPRKVGTNRFYLTWRSDISGATQVGNGMVLSFEHSLRKVILDSGDPNGSGGHEAVWLRPDGLEVVFDWDGSDYSTSHAGVHDLLTVDLSGDYVLTDKWGGERKFDQSTGMLDTSTDRNGNVFDPDYDGSYQLTGLTDDRDQSYSTSYNTDGFLAWIENPAGERWTFTYDTSGNLTEIKTPATDDQINGITTVINYDGSNRITSVEDGRGNEVYVYTWDVSLPIVDKVSIDKDDITYSYLSGVTAVEDRNGNTRRYHHSGQDITETDLWISGAAQYVTTYTYSGPDVTTVVLPRANRIDYTYDSDSNMTERRHKSTDTSSNNSSDLVHTWTYSNNFAASYTDPMGNKTTYTRDSDGNLTKVTYPTVSNPTSQSADKQFQYNGSGQVTQVTDEEGEISTRSYYTTAGSKFGLLKKIEVDPTGLDLETEVDYDSAGNVSSVTDPVGNETEYEWDTLGRLKKITAPLPLSYETKYEYDGNGNITKVEVENVDEDGDQYSNSWITTTYTYSKTDQVLTIVEETDGTNTRTTTLAYDDNGNKIRVTKPEGNKVKWVYDARNLVTSKLLGEGATEEVTLEYEYDDNGNLIVETDGRENDTTNTFDLFDRQTRRTAPLGNYIEWTRNKNGRVTKVARKDSSNNELARRSYYLDARGRLWKVSDLRKDPGTTYSDAVTLIQRHKTGHVETITDAGGNDTDFEYDAAWRRTKTTDAMGNYVDRTFDDNGNLTAWSIVEVDGASTVTHDYEATYDALNRRITTVEIDRLNSSNELTVETGYDSRSNVVWQVDRAGNPSRWTYDAANRMTKREVALATGTSIEDFTSSVVTEWGFDDNDRMDSHEDSASNETTWEYDALDRMTTATFDDLTDVAYTHDDNGNITQIVDAAGNTITDTFNDNNLRTARSITRATGFIGTTSESWSYDGLDRVTEAEDNDYKVEFEYAVLGLRSMVYKETQSNVVGSAYAKAVERTYDALGRMDSELYPSNLDLDYSWNTIGRLSSVGDGTNTIASYAYTGARVKTITYENGATSSYSFGSYRSEVSRVHHESSTPSTIVDMQYAHDDNHDRSYERFGGSGSKGEAFVYDAARRLTTAYMDSHTPSAPSTAQYLSKIEYDYDDSGNRDSVKTTPYGQTATTVTYTSNSLNEYTDVGGTTITSDANGNVTDDGTYTYHYDYRNQIVQIKQGSSMIAGYLYDALGRRVQKSTPSLVERFIYSGSRVVAVYDNSDNWQRDFVHGQGADEVLMLEQADVLDYDGDADTTETTRHFYHRNALGSVMELTDMLEAVAVSYRYDPYGEVTITRNGTTQSTDPLNQHFTFTGRLLDEESGLYYYRARYYSPALGRFVQRDPLGHTAGPNFFEYVGSSPTMLTDPTGMSPGSDELGPAPTGPITENPWDNHGPAPTGPITENPWDWRGDAPTGPITENPWDHRGDAPTGPITGNPWDDHGPAPTGPITGNPWDDHGPAPTGPIDGNPWDDHGPAPTGPIPGNPWDDHGPAPTGPIEENPWDAKGAPSPKGKKKPPVITPPSGLPPVDGRDMPGGGKPKPWDPPEHWPPLPPEPDDDNPFPMPPGGIPPLPPPGGGGPAPGGGGPPPPVAPSPDDPPLPPREEPEPKPPPVITPPSGIPPIDNR